MTLAVCVCMCVCVREWMCRRLHHRISLEIVYHCYLPQGDKSSLHDSTAPLAEQLRLGKHFCYSMGPLEAGELAL